MNVDSSASKYAPAQNLEALTHKPIQPSWVRRNFGKIILAASMLFGGGAVASPSTSVDIGKSIVGTAGNVGSEVLKGAEGVFGTKAPKTVENVSADNEYKSNQPLDGINTTKLEITKGVNIRTNPRTTYLLDSGEQADEKKISWDEIQYINGVLLNGSDEFFLDKAVVFKGQNAHNPASADKAPWALLVIGKKDGSEEAGFIFLGGETNEVVKGSNQIEWVKPDEPFLPTISPSEYGKVTLPTPTANP